MMAKTGTYYRRVDGRGLHSSTSQLNLSRSILCQTDVNQRNPQTVLTLS
jgi:hypothetical protein